MVEHALPEDDHEAERVARRAKLYVLIDGELYRSLTPFSRRR